MFYEPNKTSPDLPYDPFKACVIPRPIGWISTTSPDGKTHNLAPYSQFNNLTFDPPYVMFSANQRPDSTRKDTVVNAEASGKFCWNLATWKLRNEVNISAEQVEFGVDEFERAGLEKAFSTVLHGDDKNPVPMVKASPVRFECEYFTTMRLPGTPPMGHCDIVIGKVVGVHIDDDVITDGKLDVRKTEPIARCGYYEYAVVRETFEMVIPNATEALLGGLEGSTKRHQAFAEGGSGHAPKGLEK
jgi:flavin reductase (DIM6/NTAB) family NADH-FMN oxidoreductase RutF